MKSEYCEVFQIVAKFFLILQIHLEVYIITNHYILSPLFFNMYIGTFFSAVTPLSFLYYGINYLPMKDFMLYLNVSSLIFYNRTFRKIYFLNNLPILIVLDNAGSEGEKQIVEGEILIPSNPAYVIETVIVSVNRELRFIV